MPLLIFADDAVKQLDDAGVPVLYLYDEGDMEGVYDMISLVGEAVNCEEAAERPLMNADKDGLCF